MARNGFAYGVLGADLHVFGDGVPVYLLQNWTPPGETNDRWLLQVPSRMLNARFAVVDFVGRTTELAALRAWRDQGLRLAARWMFGAGGTGKSRLGDHFAGESAAEGWKVVTATHGPGSVLPPPGSQDLRTDGARGLLLIVDYADRWPQRHLSWLLQNLLMHRAGLTTRILFLARTVDPSPRIRAAMIDVRGDLDLMPLPSLRQDSGDRETMFRKACDAFADRYELRDRSGIVPSLPLDAPDMGLILTLQMAALVAVDAQVAGRRPQGGMAGLTFYLLDREHLHWANLASDADQRSITHRIPGSQLPADLPSGYSTPPSMMHRVVFVAVLTGAVSRSEGTALLHSVGLSGSVESMLDDHAYCYPPAEPSSVLQPLAPDRLAEDLLALTLPGHEAPYPIQPWAGDAVTALAGAPEPPTHLAQLITLLAAAASRWPHVGSSCLYPLLRAQPQLAVAAGSPALIALASIDDPDFEVLEAVVAHLPEAREFDLDVGVASVLARLTPHLVAIEKDVESIGYLYNRLSRRLFDAGRYREAADTGRRAVAVFREWIATAPQSSPVELARSLIYLSNYLTQLHHDTEAFQAAQEAVGLLRAAAPRDPQECQPLLAVGLNVLGRSAWRLGDQQTGLAITSESVQLHRSLGSPESEDFLAELGPKLRNWSALLHQAGRRDEAFTVATEALEVWRRLEDIRPGHFQPDLAGALRSVGDGLHARGSHDEAAALIDQALATYRRLAEVNPAGFEPQLASTLMSFSDSLAIRGDSDFALAAGEESVAIYERLVAADRTTYVNDLVDGLGRLSAQLLSLRFDELASATALRAVGLARSFPADRNTHTAALAAALTDLATIKSSLGAADEACAAASEATELYRMLTVNDRRQYLPDLAQALLALANLSTAEALPAAEEALRLARELANTGPDAFLYLFASALESAGHRLAEAGRITESLTPAREAIRVNRRIAELNPAAGLPRIAAGLTHLGISLSRAGQFTEAFEVAEEAVTIRRRLFEQDPTGGMPALADALTGAGSHLGELGRPSDAVTLQHEAVAIYQRLEDQNPGHYTGALAESLSRLAENLVDCGRASEAVGPAEQSVLLSRNARPADPFRVGGTLANLAAALAAAGRQESALGPAIEAVAVNRTLTLAESDRYRPFLAGSLGNLAARLDDVGRAEDALAANREAIEVWRHLADSEPQVYLGDLAGSLGGAGIRLAGLGDYEQALLLTGEALEIRLRPDSRTNSARLAATFSNYGLRLADLNRHEEAASYTRQAVYLCRQLVQRDQDAHRPALAAALFNLGTHLINAARFAEAAAPAGEAAALFQDLVRDDRDSYAGDLADATHNVTLIADATGPGKTSVGTGDYTGSTKQRWPLRWLLRPGDGCSVPGGTNDASEEGARHRKGSSPPG